MGLTVGGGITWGAGASWIQYQAPSFQTYGIELNQSGLIGQSAYAGKFGAMTGLSAATPSQFLFSIWLNPRTMPWTLPRIFEMQTNSGFMRVQIALSTTVGTNPGYLKVTISDNNNRTIVLDAASTPIPCGSWSHVAMSAFVPALAGSRSYQCYINNAAAPLTVTANPLFTTIEWRGSASDRNGIFTEGFNIGTWGTQYFGNFAEYYFAPGQYLDLSVTNNLRKFITASGGTPDLGVNGANPTGTSPTIYLKGPTTSLIGTGPNRWINYGTGGDFPTLSGQAFTYNSATNPPSTP